MRVFLGSVLVLGIALADPSFAFDGKRKGWVLGGGLGAGFTSYSIDVSGVRRPSRAIDDGEVGPGWSGVRIGYGFSERTMLYVGELATTSSSVYETISGVGLLYYLADDAPSLYVTSLAGISYVSPDGLDAHTGWGLAGGIGWEFTRHWSVEASLGWLRASRDEVLTSWFDPYDRAGPAIDTSMWTLTVTINGLAY